MGKSILLNEVVYLRWSAPNICTKKFWIMTLSAKKASASGDCVPKTPTKFYTSFTSYNHCWFVQNVNNWTHLSNHVVICFKYLLQICTKMNSFKFDFSKYFWGGAPSPFPEPLPPFLLGRCLQFGLRSQFMGASHLLLWLRSRSSGASRPRFGLRPRLSISQIGLTPKIYSWIRQCWSVPSLANSLIGHW